MSEETRDFKVIHEDGRITIVPVPASVAYFCQGVYPFYWSGFAGIDYCARTLRDWNIRGNFV